jgi:hypothetical protein
MSGTGYCTREVDAHLSVDSLDGREVRLIYTDADLDSLVLLFSPAEAAKLGQQLISLANQLRPTP